MDVNEDIALSNTYECIWLTLTKYLHGDVTIPSKSFRSGLKLNVQTFVDLKGNYKDYLQYNESLFFYLLG